MNSKNIFLSMIAIFFVSSLFASKAFACRQGCINSSTTATTTCACSDKGSCDCAKNRKDCKCRNCDNASNTTSTCGCNDKKDCKCAQDGKDCKCGNCAVKEARPMKDKANEQGRLSRLKGWLKGLAFWKKK
ncbi:hypothetical protein KBC01_02205 [Candidatus Parcubacteria bacterium]|nr:hypothetical protein [Candidatus Parcubacteria bacterium]